MTVALYGARRPAARAAKAVLRSAAAIVCRRNGLPARTGLKTRNRLGVGSRGPCPREGADYLPSGPRVSINRRVVDCARGRDNERLRPLKDNERLRPLKNGMSGSGRKP